MSDLWPSEQSLIAMQAVVDELEDADRANVLDRAANVRELASNGPGGVALAPVWSEHQVAIDRNTPESRDWGSGWADTSERPPLQVFRGLREGPPRPRRL